MSSERSGTTGRRGRKARETRAAMARAALELARERGVAAVAVEDVAERADVSRRTFSRYFGSKEDAVLDPLRADFDRINAALAARPPGEPPVAAYLGALRAWLADPDEPGWNRREGARELLELAFSEPALAAALRRIGTAAEEESIAIVAARLGVDGDRDPHPAVAVGAGAAALLAAARIWGRHPDADLAALVERAFAALADTTTPTDPTA
ncbi:TetR family transcriptional regulator [Actinomadura parmotrematis]|uniref:TetR family transcriptional regulator n=1 Tax=Actinomadura parmotrematis TaxID=2864039 RepID=A0ABS7FYJ7_9ACTN|nr:TetR family transcriptional regulator [Actinomadura parmotrematis]MBW8484662.1 TetR family transcriptional regulator [Actinomadura parmotrematis]